ncbi:MAG: ATP synthase F1 subunit epsilon [Lachnospiraceae bacterium]|nr:ATP synthase F1 subunit epsilon [Lachnospiraceae bacterium]
MADNTIKLRIVTPDRVFFEGDVVMVEFNTTEGEIGIYKNHVPTTCIVKPGILTITTEEGVKNAALHAGFVEILKDSVTILAELVEWPTEIDVERAEKAKTRAEERLGQKADGMDTLRAELALQRAIARISSVKM